MLRFEVQTYAIMRIVVGFLYLWHGTSKLFDFPPSGHEMSAFMQWVAGPIEFLCGLLIFVGLFTRWAAFIASGTMAFAYWIGHGTQAILPIVNHGEMAFIFCFVFLYISAKGSGVFSIDYYWNKKKHNGIGVWN